MYSFIVCYSQSGYPLFFRGRIQICCKLFNFFLLLLFIYKVFQNWSYYINAFLHWLKNAVEAALWNNFGTPLGQTDSNNKWISFKLKLGMAD